MGDLGVGPILEGPDQVVPAPMHVAGAVIGGAGHGVVAGAGRRRVRAELIVARADGVVRDEHLHAEDLVAFDVERLREIDREFGVVPARCHAGEVQLQRLAALGDELGVSVDRGEVPPRTVRVARDHRCALEIGQDFALAGRVGIRRRGVHRR